MSTLPDILNRNRKFTCSGEIHSGRITFVFLFLLNAVNHTASKSGQRSLGGTYLLKQVTQEARLIPYITYHSLWNKGGWSVGEAVPPSADLLLCSCQIHINQWTCVRISFACGRRRFVPFTSSSKRRSHFWVSFKEPFSEVAFKCVRPCTCTYLNFLLLLLLCCLYIFNSLWLLLYTSACRTCTCVCVGAHIAVRWRQSHLWRKQADRAGPPPVSSPPVITPGGRSSGGSTVRWRVETLIASFWFHCWGAERHVACACGVIIWEISMHKKQFSAGSVDVKGKVCFVLFNHRPVCVSACLKRRCWIVVELAWTRRPCGELVWRWAPR